MGVTYENKRRVFQKSSLRCHHPLSSNHVDSVYALPAVSASIDTVEDVASTLRQRQLTPLKHNGYAPEFDQHAAQVKNISRFLIHRAGMTVKSGAQSGAVTLKQRFGRYGVPGALNLNTHFHRLYLNGVYDAKGYFWPMKPPTREELDVITHTIATRHPVRALVEPFLTLAQPRGGVPLALNAETA